MAEMTEKLQQHVKRSVLDFSSDGGLNVYEFENVNYSEVRRNADKNAWAQLGLDALSKLTDNRRNRQQRNEDLQRGRALPRGMQKLPHMHEWQFFQMDRLTELHEVEKETREAQDEDELGETGQEERRLFLKELTEEKQKLLEDGFGTWKKSDYNDFVKGCIEHGRSNIERIAADMPGKDVNEVRRYATVFWERYHEIPGADKKIMAIEAAETKRRINDETNQEIRAKVSSYRFPWEQLRILSYGTQKIRHFTEDNDRYLLNVTNLLGYGRWDEIKAFIRSPKRSTRRRRYHI